jgi:hypothetical protein
MTSSSARADGVQPVSVPSSIAARQRADRSSRLRARLLMLIVLLHVAYFLVPILPCASCRAVGPWLLWLPPACVALVCISLYMMIRRWVAQRRQATQFMHLPPLEKVP